MELLSNVDIDLVVYFVLGLLDYLFALELDLMLQLGFKRLKALSLPNEVSFQFVDSLFSYFLQYKLNILLIQSLLFTFTERSYSILNFRLEEPECVFHGSLLLK